MKRTSMMFVALALFGNLSLASAGLAPLADAPSPRIDAPAEPTPIETIDPIDPDEGGGSDLSWSDPDDTELGDAEPGAGAKKGDVLYHVYWEGHGFTTVVADYYFFRQQQKVSADCAAAGGELKNVRTSSYGVGWYKDEGWGDCVKK